MDHRVSKDMISSGMIPAGEKKKEDLGRTQYGSAPSPSSLADAYKSMYDKKEETLNEHHKKDADGNTIPHEDEEINEILGMGAIATAGKALLTKIGKTAIGSKAKDIVKKVGQDFVKKPLDTAFKTSMVVNSLPKPGLPGMPAVTKKRNQGGMVSADADLFDIVKGQLLDEELSEEEIRDIMLTLTPDEILSEIKDYQMDSLKRQIAPGGGKDYKIEDMKNVQNLTKKEVLKPFEKRGARTKPGIVGSYVEN